MAQLSGDPPQPARASTPPEFVAALRDLRLWSGLTFRQLAAKAQTSGDYLAASTIAAALGRSTLPRREVVAGIARACGLDEASVAGWVAARDALLTTARPSASTYLDDASPPGDPAIPPPRPWSPPAMLPCDIADFTGRDQQLAALRAQLTTAGLQGDEEPNVMAIAAVNGMGGVGKTTLALHAAHLVAGSYPDGQLWVDLRDPEANPLDPGDVLARFLRALGMDDRAIPGGLSERAEVYRTLLAGRRVLVVLDNAASEKQVRPLLPGSATCSLLITSRIRLTGIEGAQHIDLEMFSPGEAIDLLTRIVDERRVSAEVEEAAEIVELCGGLPLAVRIAGARLAARPAWQLGHMAAILHDERRRLDRLSTGDLGVRASLAVSYRELDEQPQRLLQLLALFDVPDFPAWLAATMVDCSSDQATEHLEALVDAQLLTVAGTDAAGQVRYGIHDLVRLFAIESAPVVESRTAVHQALIRGFGAWVALAERMAPAMPGPCYAPIGSSLPRPSLRGVEERVLRLDPRDWFDAEWNALLSGARQACRLGLADLAFDLAGCLEKYFDLRGMYRDWATLNAEVMALCKKAGNVLGEAVMLRGLLDVTTWTTEGRDGDAMARLHAEAVRLLEMFTGVGHEQGASDAAVMCAWALAATGSYQDAVVMATEALRLAERSNHLGGQARAHLALGVAHFEHGRFDVAAAHAGLTLDRARELGNPRWEATALQFSGIAHRELGDFRTSRQCLDDSLAISRSHGDNYTEVLTLVALARLHLREGDPRARQAAEAALVLSREYSMYHHLAEALELLGELELAHGSPIRAIGYLEESVALWRTRGWHSFQAAALASLGRAYAETDPQAARKAFREARMLFIRLGNGAKAAELERLSRALLGSAPPEYPKETNTRALFGRAP